MVGSPDGVGSGDGDGVGSGVGVGVGLDVEAGSGVGVEVGGGVGVDPRDGAAAVPVPPGAEPEVVEPDVGRDEGVLPRGREGGVLDRFCDASSSTGKTGPSWVTGCAAGPAEVPSAGVAPGVHSSGRSSPAVGGVSPTASS